MNYEQKPSGLILPAEKKPEPTQQELDERFYRTHRVCPQCRSNNFERTTGPFIERNSVRCSCGFKGITSDLVPE